MRIIIALLKNFIISIATGPDVNLEKSDEENQSENGGKQPEANQSEDSSVPSAKGIFIGQT